MRRCLLLACLWGLAAAAGAQIWEPPRPQRLVLKNGLTVLLSENRQLPLVSVDVMVRAGSINDPAGMAGLSNFTAEMLARGTLKRSALELAEGFDFVGAQYSVRCDHDAVFLSLTALSRDFERTVPLLFEMLTSPAFDSSEVSRMKGELISAIEAQQDQPNLQSVQAFNRMLYGEHPYAHPVIGTQEALVLVGGRELAGHHKKYYVPNNCVVAVVGDFNNRTARKAIERHLGGWKAREIKDASLPPIPVPDQPRVEMIHRQINQSYINLGFLGPRRDDPDYQAIRVMNYILGGGGFVSRLVRTIRMAQGLAYDVDSYYDPRLDYGPYILSVQTKCASSDTAVKGLLNEMRRIRSEPVSDEELKEAKDFIRGSYPFRFETNGQMARQYLYLELYRLGPDYFSRDMKRTMEVTKDEVMAAARRFLRPDGYLMAMTTDTLQTRLDLPGAVVVKKQP